MMGDHSAVMNNHSSKKNGTSVKSKRTKLSSKSETNNLAIKYLKERNYSVSSVAVSWTLEAHSEY